jgi:hypothetical protein
MEHQLLFLVELTAKRQSQRRMSQLLLQPLLQLITMLPLEEPPLTATVQRQQRQKHHQLQYQMNINRVRMNFSKMESQGSRSRAFLQLKVRSLATLRLP